MKVCTDACILGAWTAGKIRSLQINEILDIGCGTGLLSLMLAQNTNAVIDAVEINTDAAKQAEENVIASPWSNRINIINDSIQDFDNDKNCDLIICNPPFYEDDLRSADESKNAAKHDTSLRLEDLLVSIKQNLNEGGLVSILLPFHRTNYFEKAAEKISLFVQEKLLVKQTPAHNYFRSVLLLSSDHTKAPVINELIIHDEKRNYTEAFKMLMKDYYLDL